MTAQTLRHAAGSWSVVVSERTPPGHGRCARAAGGVRQVVRGKGKRYLRPAFQFSPQP